MSWENVNNKNNDDKNKNNINLNHNFFVSNNKNHKLLTI